MTTIADLKVLITADTSDAETKLASTNAAMKSLHEGGIAATIGLTILGETLTEIGKAVEGFATKAVTAFTSWQERITQIQNESGSTAEQMKIIESSIIDAGQHGSASLETLATGMQKIKDFGFDAADATTILNQSMKVATATGADAGASTNLLAKTLHQYHLDASDAARMTDVFLYAVQKGNITFDDFASHAGVALGIGAALKVPYEQVAAALSALTRNGFDAAKSQTQLTALFTHLVKPAAQAKDEIKRVSDASGINLVKDFSAAGLSSKGLKGVVDDLRLAFQKMGYSQEAATQSTLLMMNAQRGGLGMVQLITQGYGDFNALLDAYGEKGAAAGVTTEAFANTQKTLAFQLGILKNLFDELMISIGKTFGGIFMNAILLAKQLILAFLEMDPAVKRFILVTAGLVGAFLLVLGPMLMIVAVLPLVAAGFGILAGPLGFLVLSFAALTATILTFVIALVTGTQGPLAQVVSFFDLIVVPAFEKLSEWFKATLPAAIAIAKNFVENIFLPALGLTVKIILEDLLPILEALGTFLIAVLGPAVSTLVTIWNGVAPIILTVANTIKDVLVPALTKATEWIDKYKFVVQLAVGTIVTLLLVNLLGAIYSFTAAAIAATATLIVAWGPLIILIGSLIAISYTLVENWDTISAKAKEIWDGIHNYVVGAIAGISAAILVMNASTIASVISAMTALTAAGVAFSIAWGPVLLVIAAIVLALAGLVLALNYLRDHWNEIWPGLVSVVQGAGSAIGTAIDGIKDSVSGLLSDINHQLMDWHIDLHAAANTAIESFTRGVVELKPTVKSSVQDLIDTGIMEPMAQVGPKGFEQGYQLTAHFAQAIHDSRPPVQEAVHAMIDDFDLVNPELSEKGKTAGTSFNSGIAIGINNSLSTTQTAVDGCTEAMQLAIERATKYGHDTGHGFGSAIAEGVSKELRPILDQVINVSKELGSPIDTAFAPDTGWDIGTSYGQKIADGIADKKKIIAQQVLDVSTLLMGAQLMQGMGGVWPDNKQRIADYTAQLKELQNLARSYQDSHEGELDQFQRGIGVFAPPPPNPIDYNSIFGTGEGDDIGDKAKKAKDKAAKAKSAIQEAADQTKSISEAIMKWYEAASMLTHLPTVPNLSGIADNMASQIDTVMMSLQKVALKFAYEVKISKDTTLLGTEIIGNYAEAAGKVFGAFTTAFGFFEKVSQSGERVLFGSTKLVTLTNALSEKIKIIMNVFGPMSAGWDEFATKQVTNFADASQKSFDAFSKAFDFFEKISSKGELVLFGSAKLASLTVTLAEKIKIVMNTFGPMTAGWDKFATDQVSMFADASGKVFSSFTTAFGFFEGIAIKGDRILNGPAKLAELSVKVGEKIKIIMNNFGASIKDWNNPDWTTQIKLFAEASEAVFKAFVDAFNFFILIADSGQEVLSNTDKLIELSNRMATTIHVIMNNFGAAIAAWKNPDWITQVKLFADASGAVFKAFTDAFKFFIDLAAEGAGILANTDSLISLSQKLSVTIEAIITNFHTAIKDWTNPQWTTDIENFGKATEVTFKGFKDAFDYFINIGQDAKDVEAGLDSFVTFSAKLGAKISEIVKNLIPIAETTGTKLEFGQVSEMMKAAGDSFKGLTDALKFISELTADQDLLEAPDLLKNLPTLMDNIKAAMKRFSDDLPELSKYATTAASQTGKTFQDIFKALTDAAKFINDLSSIKSVGESKITVFFDDLKKVLVKIPEMTATLAVEAQKAAKDFGEKLLPAITMLRAALDLFKGITGDEEGKGKLLNIDPNAIGELTGKLWLLLTKLRTDLLDKIAPELQRTANEFATRIGPAIKVLHDALDLFIKLVPDSGGKGGLKHIDPDAIGELVGDLYLVLHHLRNLIIGGEFQGDFQTRAEQFMGTLHTVLDVIKEVIDIEKELSGLGEGGANFSGLSATLSGFITAVNQAMAQLLNPTDNASFLGMWKQAFSEAGFKGGNENNIWYLFNHAFDGMFDHIAKAWIPQVSDILKTFFNNLNGWFSSLSGLVDTWVSDWDRAATAVEEAVNRMLIALGKLPGGTTPPGFQNPTFPGGNNPRLPGGNNPHNPSSSIKDSIIVNGTLQAVVPEANHRTLTSIKQRKNYLNPGMLPNGI